MTPQTSPAPASERCGKASIDPLLFWSSVRAGMALLNEDPRQQQFRERLIALGFDQVRFAAVPAVQLSGTPAQRGIRGWIERGLQADMHWIERSLEKRLNPDLVLPGVRSVVMLGVSYWSKELSRTNRDMPQWARYALYEDYHDTIKPALIAAGCELERLYNVAQTDYRYYVDTGPVLDRGWAARAGIGFIGKNAMLISREHGNWLFLAAILTRVDFAPDEPIRKPADRNLGQMPDVPAPGLLCGKCTRCLDACPTAAFTEPGIVDARRCISYHTIENKGVIPRALRSGIGDRIYGCDVCLEVCPWNRFAQEARRLLLSSRDDISSMSLGDILALTPERFADVFRRTPIKRLKLGGLLRNASVVAGNSGDVTLLPVLRDLATRHRLALVRAHAVWAIFRLGGGSTLAEARLREEDATVLAEYAAEDETPGGFKDRV